MLIILEEFSFLKLRDAVKRIVMIKEINSDGILIEVWKFLGDVVLLVGKIVYS